MSNTENRRDGTFLGSLPLWAWRRLERTGETGRDDPIIEPCMFGQAADPFLQTVVIAVTFLIILAAKIFLSSRLDLSPDGAFYWLESTRPAFSYSDVPLLTPALVRAGTWLWGDAPVAARGLFLAVGSLLPPAVYLLARAIAGSTGAIHSAHLVLLFPMPAAIGLLIIPDVPLALLSLFALAAFFHATRHAGLRSWIAFGAIGALAVNAHYRFLFFIFAATIYIALTRRGRSNLRNPGLWSAISMIAAGAIPVVYFNLSNDFAALSFQFMDRHPWAFDPSGLVYVFEQIIWTTPLIFILLAMTLWRCIVRGMEGSDPHAFVAIFAGANTLPFFVLSPWMDHGTAFTAHWPVLGYIYLLVFLPETLSVIARRLGLSARQLFRTVAGSGLLFVSVTFLVLTLSAFYDDIPRGLRLLATDRMAGWSDVGDRVTELRESGGWRADAPVVANEYYLATQIAFTTKRTEGVYALDMDRARVMGRQTQLEIWDLFEEGLRRTHAHEDALVVIERGAPERQPDLIAVFRLCEIFEKVRFIDELELFDGERRYAFYSGERIRPLRSDPRPFGGELPGLRSCFD